jgi:hypothetical protein
MLLPPDINGDLLLDCMLNYKSGDAKIGLSATVAVKKLMLNAVIPVKMSVTLKSLAGKLQIRVPPFPAQRFAISFYQEPAMDFEIDMSVGEKASSLKSMILPMVKDMIVGRLKLAMIERFVAPHRKFIRIPTTPKSDPLPDKELKVKVATSNNMMMKQPASSSSAPVIPQMNVLASSTDNGILAGSSSSTPTASPLLSPPRSRSLSTAGLPSTSGPANQGAPIHSASAMANTNGFGVGGVSTPPRSRGSDSDMVNMIEESVQSHRRSLSASWGDPELMSSELGSARTSLHLSCLFLLENRILTDVFDVIPGNTVRLSASSSIDIPSSHRPRPMSMPPQPTAAPLPSNPLTLQVPPASNVSPSSSPEKDPHAAPSSSPDGARLSQRFKAKVDRFKTKVFGMFEKDDDRVGHAAPTSAVQSSSGPVQTTPTNSPPEK